MAGMKLVAGNWKMHGTSADLCEVEAIAAAAQALDGRVEVALCVPTTLIHRASEAAPGFRTLGPVEDMRDGKVRLHLPEGFEYRSFQDTDGPPVVLFVGTLKPWHGTEHLIRAAALAGRRFDPRRYRC